MFPVPRYQAIRVPFTMQQVEECAYRHGSQGIQFYPPVCWENAITPEGSTYAYHVAYVRGMAASYKGDVSPRCPLCGYNLADAVDHGDHAKCGGKIPPAG